MWRNPVHLRLKRGCLSMSIYNAFSYYARCKRATHYIRIVNMDGQEDERTFYGRTGRTGIPTKRALFVQ